MGDIMTDQCSNEFLNLHNAGMPTKYGLNGSPFEVPFDDEPQVTKSPPPRLLCIDDDSSFLIWLQSELNAYPIDHAASLDAALLILEDESVDFILLDIGLGNENGLDGIARIKKINRHIPIIMVTGYTDSAYIVEAIKRGACDYISKPFKPIDLIARIEKNKQAAFESEKHDAICEALFSNVDAHAIIGNSPLFTSVLKTARKLKGYHHANILIQGESGTGKELIARYIHGLEANPRRPFIVVNCAAIPEHLAESELFGHEKGAFTGAIQKKIGKFMLADGGDIFLDEIGCLSGSAQSKLLRVLQEREFCAVGSNQMQQSNFRVIAATNDNLMTKITDGLFRLDLYHRLCTVNLSVPALRDRPGDIPLLANYFLEKHSQLHGKKKLSHAAIQKLQIYDWPGNARELENAIHHAYIVNNGDVIDPTSLPMPDVVAGTISHNYQIPAQKLHFPVGMLPIALPQKEEDILPLKTVMSTIERAYIDQSMQIVDGKKQTCAYRLDLCLSALYVKLRR